MTQITFIPKQSFLKVPWKNGQGMTYEIFKYLLPNSDRFCWRLSIAEVKEDGPFSNFEGYQRNITVLSGTGMTLTVDEHSSEILAPFQSFTFRGDATTTCVLAGGKIHDFNVIYAPDLVRTEVMWLNADQHHGITISPNSHCFLISGVGEVTVHVDASAYHMNTWDVVHVETMEQECVLSFPEKFGTVIGVVKIHSV